MVRRDLLGLGLLGTTAAGVWATTARAGGADDGDGQHQHHHQHGEAHDACIKACQECSRACNETLGHCLNEIAQGKNEHAKLIRLVGDCAKFCTLSFELMCSDSPLMVHSCAACAEACKACGAECDRFDEAEVKDCAKHCHACEATCMAMVRAMGGRTSQ
jgi:hypothetical protein